jgi:hypothetical protein
MDSLIHIDNINNLPNEMVELILDNMPIQTLLDCNNCPVIENYIIKKYFSLNNILKNMKVLIRHRNYTPIVRKYNIKYVTMIVDAFMSIINNNGGLVKNKDYNGEPVDLYLLRFKSKSNCFELISKFVDNDKESDGKCFGYIGWNRHLYIYHDLINKLEYMFRINTITPPYESIEIIKINYPNGYNKSIDGIDYISEHKETIMIKFI